MMSGAEVGQRAYDNFSKRKNDPSDPSPWLALFLDRSLPMDNHAKAAFLTDASSRSRQFLLPIIRPFCRLAIILNQILKVLLPTVFSSSKVLHYLIYLGQKYFVSPEGNYIILRHFHLGSEILKFIAANAKNAEINLKAIRPEVLRQIYTEEIYVNHDLNLFNFVIQLNESLKKHQHDIVAKDPLDFSMIQQGDFNIREIRNGWTNVLDVETAVEIYTPLFQLFLRDQDFWRAHHSLQFDETIGLYIAKILRNPNHLGLVNNKHPLSPLTGTKAAYRLMLHGISSELLHGILAQERRAQSDDKVNRSIDFSRER